jgi:transcriptional regulator with XRE-family HTH domain
VSDLVAETITSVRKQVGILITRVRKDASLTQQDLAKALSCSQAKVNKLEKGKSQLKQDDLRAILTACHVAPEAEAELRELVSNDRQGRMPRGQRALRTPAGPLDLVPQYFREFTELEPTAHTLRAWHGERVPGFLQSEPYMINQFRSTNRSTQTVTQLMITRNRRKRVLDLEHPPRHQILLGEGAFRRVPGGHDLLILRDQLEYLVRLLDRYPQLSIHMVLFDARLAYVPNDFTIMDFVDGTTNFVYFEYPGGGQHLEDRAVYDACFQQWDELRGAALQRLETRNWFADLAADCRRQLERCSARDVGDR